MDNSSTCFSQGDTKNEPFLFEEAFGELPTEFHQGRTLRGSRGQKANQSSPPKGAIDISALEPLVVRALAKIDRRPIGESLWGARHNAWIVKKGLQALHTALEGYDIHEKRAMQILRSARFVWHGKYEEVQGKRRLVHYYTPDAIAHLHSKLSKDTVFNRLEAAAHLNITVELFDYLVSQPANGIKGQKITRKGRKTTECYDKAAMALAEIAVTKTPGTQPGDRPV